MAKMNVKGSITGKITDITIPKSWIDGEDDINLSEEKNSADSVSLAGFPKVYYTDDEFRAPWPRKNNTVLMEPLYKDLTPEEAENKKDFIIKMKQKHQEFERIKRGDLRLISNEDVLRYLEHISGGRSYFDFGDIKSVSIPSPSDNNLSEEDLKGLNQVFHKHNLDDDEFRFYRSRYENLRRIERFNIYIEAVNNLIENNVIKSKKVLDIFNQISSDYSDLLAKQEKIYDDEGQKLKQIKNIENRIKKYKKKFEKTVVAIYKHYTTGKYANGNNEKFIKLQFKFLRERARKELLSILRRNGRVGFRTYYKDMKNKFFSMRKNNEAEVRARAKKLAKEVERKAADALKIGRNHVMTTHSFSVGNSLKRGNAIARYTGPKTNISPKSVQQMFSMDNIFPYVIQEENTWYNKYTKKMQTQPKKIGYKDSPEYRRTVRLNAAVIPETYLKNELLNKTYGAITAATFFQLLVSNTPIDEEYDFIEKRVKTSTRNINIYDEDGELKDDARLEKDLYQKGTKIYNIRHHHKPDNDYVRNNWLFHYKGKTFRSGDLYPHWFAIKGDKESINALALFMYRATRDVKDNNNSFTYENTNRRFMMLEYGGYEKNSGPNKGSKYGSLYEHGVTNHRTWQAPYGVMRAVETLWNVLTSSGKNAGYVTNFINSNLNQLDVSDIKSSLMQKIIAKEPSIKEVGFVDEKTYRLIGGKE